MKKVLSFLFAVIIFFSMSVGDVMCVKAESPEIYTCYFYSAEGNLLSSAEVAEGSQLSPFIAPWVDGMMFMYWYKVDYLLQGDSTEPHDFDSPVTESLYLKAYYVRIVEDEEEPAAEEPAAEEPVAEEPAAEEPVAEEPVAEEPVAEEPVAGKPLTEEAEDPVTEELETGKSLTEEAAAEEQLTPEERRILLKEEIDATNPNRKISFYASWGDKLAPEIGDEITIHAELSGYEGLNYVIRWQVKYNSLEDWHDLDVSGDSYKLTISLHNLDWQFRVAVDIIEAE